MVKLVAISVPSSLPTPKEDRHESNIYMYNKLKYHLQFQPPRPSAAVPAHVQDVQPRSEGVQQDRPRVPTEGTCRCLYRIVFYFYTYTAIR